jgi:hypothetical protein
MGEWDWEPRRLSQKRVGSALFKHYKDKARAGISAHLVEHRMLSFVEFMW